jgi:hypothetical protein
MNNLTIKKISGNTAINQTEVVDAFFVGLRLQAAGTITGELTVTLIDADDDEHLLLKQQMDNVENLSWLPKVRIPSSLANSVRVQWANSGGATYNCEIMTI